MWRLPTASDFFNSELSTGSTNLSTILHDLGPIPIGGILDAGKHDVVQKSFGV